jgi:hypothetical protein
MSLRFSPASRREMASRRWCTERPDSGHCESEHPGGFRGRAKLLNQDIIAFGARLARYLRPELKAKSIRNLFRSAFKRACANLPVAQVRWDDDAAFPEFLKGFREDRDISVDRHMWGLRGVAFGRESSPRGRPIATGHGPGAYIASCRAHAGISAIAGVRDGLTATCLLFVSHRFYSLCPCGTRATLHRRDPILSRQLFPAIRCGVKFERRLTHHNLAFNDPWESFTLDGLHKVRSNS